MVTERFFKAWQGKRMIRRCERGPGQSCPRPAGSFSRLGLAIPCWVAPQQSPTPFRQAIRSILCKRTEWARYQPNAPTGKHVNRRDQVPAKRAHRLRQCRNPQNPCDRPLPTCRFGEITGRNPTNHWLVSTRPSVAGFNAPRDNVLSLATDSMPVRAKKLDHGNRS